MENNEEHPDLDKELDYISTILHEIFRNSSHRICLDRIIISVCKNPQILEEYSSSNVRSETDFNDLYVIIIKHLGRRLRDHFGNSQHSERIASDLIYPIARKTYSEIYPCDTQ